MGPSFFKSKTTVVDQDERSDSASIIDNGSLHYTAAGGSNSNQVTYQEASGAPIEVDSPLGYSVGYVTVIFLNLSKMIGTGVFTTRESLFP